MENLDSTADLIVIDVGNSRVKLGHYPAQGDCGVSLSGLPIAAPPLPEPDETLRTTIEQIESGTLTDWIDQLQLEQQVKVVVGSVSRVVHERLQTILVASLQELEIEHQIHLLTNDQIPIEVDLVNPSKVGIDRLAAAVAANQLRRDDLPAIVIDVGTAVTVDLVSASGTFEGGAIMPGVRMSAEALHERTDALPDCNLVELKDAPDAVGKDTLPAIQAGLFWGVVGAIRELIDRQRDGLTVAPQVFLTGGAAPSIARLIGGPDYTVRHVAHLTLSGIALAARSLKEKP